MGNIILKEGVLAFDVKYFWSGKERERKVDCNIVGNCVNKLLVRSHFNLK